mmetsp:Transcript_17708/g.57003  ORF Transcript_17708/g.57003 Transcript_17708/m.57003 type:complete len:413 (-) Transcript_17708:407-1645(-)
MEPPLSTRRVGAERPSGGSSPAESAPALLPAGSADSASEHAAEEGRGMSAAPAHSITSSPPRPARLACQSTSSSVVVARIASDVHVWQSAPPRSVASLSAKRTLWRRTVAPRLAIAPPEPSTARLASKAHSDASRVAPGRRSSAPPPLSSERPPRSVTRRKVSVAFAPTTKRREAPPASSTARLPSAPPSASTVKCAPPGTSTPLLSPSACRSRSARPAGSRTTQAGPEDEDGSDAVVEARDASDGKAARKWHGPSATAFACAATASLSRMAMSSSNSVPGTTTLLPSSLPLSHERRTASGTAMDGCRARAASRSSHTDGAPGRAAAAAAIAALSGTPEATRLTRRLASWRNGCACHGSSSVTSSYARSAASSSRRWTAVWARRRRAWLLCTSRAAARSIVAAASSKPPEAA